MLVKERSTIYLLEDRLIVIVTGEIFNKCHFSHFEDKVGLFSTTLIADVAL